MQESKQHWIKATGAVVLLSCFWGWGGGCQSEGSHCLCSSPPLPCQLGASCSCAQESVVRSSQITQGLQYRQGQYKGWDRQNMDKTACRVCVFVYKVLLLCWFESTSLKMASLWCGYSCTGAKVFPLLQILTAQRRNKLPYYEIVYTSVTINIWTSVTAPVLPLYFCRHYHPTPTVVKPFEILWVEQVLKELKPRGTGLAWTSKVFKLTQLFFAWSNWESCFFFFFLFRME